MVYECEKFLSSQLKLNICGFCWCSSIEFLAWVDEVVDDVFEVEEFFHSFNAAKATAHGFEAIFEVAVVAFDLIVVVF